MPDSKVNLEIIAPTGIVYQGQVSAVSIPTYQGQITVLPHHTALFTKLSEGEVVINPSGNEDTIVIAGGFAQVENNSVHILSDYAIRADSIKQAQVEEKKRMAEGKLKQQLTNREFTSADKDLKMSILELKVAQKMRKRHQG